LKRYVCAQVCILDQPQKKGCIIWYGRLSITQSMRPWLVSPLIFRSLSSRIILSRLSMMVVVFQSISKKKLAVLQLKLSLRSFTLVVNSAEAVIRSLVDCTGLVLRSLMPSQHNLMLRFIKMDISTSKSINVG